MSDSFTHPVHDSTYGFWRLVPVPTEEELESFYGAEYYSANPGRAPDIKRLQSEAESAAPEREWRNSTIYTDVAHYLTSLFPSGGRAIDVGCGTGEFVVFLGARYEWSVSGIELSPDGVALATNRGADVIRGTIDDVTTAFGGDFDVLTMFNVLEHVRDPLSTLRAAHRLLRPGGALVVQVPNDFALFQLAVHEHLDVDPWWIAVPDHISYFDFESLEATLSRHGFETAIRYGTFPMEFFLLAGLDYLEDRSAGAEAHRRRCAFEMSMAGERRRDLFERFGRAGLGRNAMLVALRV